MKGGHVFVHAPKQTRIAVWAVERFVTAYFFFGGWASL